MSRRRTPMCGRPEVMGVRDTVGGTRPSGRRANATPSFAAMEWRMSHTIREDAPLPPSLPPEELRHRTNVHGTVFAARAAVVDRITVGDQLLLVPDLLTDDDPPAVWVHVAGGDVLGYVPRRLRRGWPLGCSLAGAAPPASSRFAVPTLRASIGLRSSLSDRRAEHRRVLATEFTENGPNHFVTRSGQLSVGTQVLAALSAKPG